MLFNNPTQSQSKIVVVSLLAIALGFILPALATAQTAQPKPEVVEACPADMPQLHFDAMILKGEKTQKVWYLHNDHVGAGKTCVVINGWTQAGPAGWEPMKGDHEFILAVSIDGSTQKLVGDSQDGKRTYVIEIPDNHDGISWVCNHAGHFIHSGGSIAADGQVTHNGVAKVAAK